MDKLKEMKHISLTSNPAYPKAQMLSSQGGEKYTEGSAMQYKLELVAHET